MSAGAPSLPVTPEESTDDQLAKRRLGIAGSLFAALQCKHAATASHSIRVALTCSAWATRLDFDPRQREQLEIVALLHDIGIVGTPDHVLLKPTRLDSDEAAIMGRARAMSVEILRRSCTSTEILGVVENISAWYDGSRGSPTTMGTGCPSGEQIPLAARMIAVAEAFDAMTTDRVYRPALSQERAMAELFRCAGSQFDPILVRQFVEMLEGDRGQLRKQVATRWLLSLDPQTANAYWDFTAAPAAGSTQGEASLFEAKLLDNMYDAVVFVDSQGRIVQWNHGAERLTGIAGASIRQQRWHPDILKLSDEKNRADQRGRLSRAGGDQLRRAIVAAAHGLGTQRPLRGRRQPRHSGDRQRRQYPGRDPAAARRLVGDLAGATLPEPGRQGQPRPADPGRQPRRVRSRARHVRHRPPAAAGALRPADVRPRPLQAGERHLRAPGGRRSDQEPGRLAQGRLPPGRPGGPLRRRGVRHAPGRLRQHHRQPPRRSDPPGPRRRFRSRR